MNYLTSAIFPGGKRQIGCGRRNGDPTISGEIVSSLWG